MTKILDGRSLAAEILDYLAKLVKEQATRPPTIAFLIIGDDPASQTYVNAKKKQAERIGFRSLDYSFPKTIEQQDLLDRIAYLNNDPNVDGILVQLPLPSHLDKRKIICAISPEKDVDGFHPQNAGKLLQKDFSGFLPCTPIGIAILLYANKINLTGKRVTILGRSDIVGKPLAALLMQNHPLGNASVTVLHTQSQQIERETQRAEILIAAAGVPHLIGPQMLQKGAVVVDVGIHRQEKSLIGDVDFDSVAQVCSYITPVPGGIGPMTIASLLSNTYKGYMLREKGLLFDPLFEKYNLPY